MKETRTSHRLRKRREPKVDQCLILAAGNGSRLISRSGGFQSLL